MRGTLDRLAAVLGAIVVALFAVMMTLVFVQVVNRYALGLPLFWTEEVVRMLLVWSVMIGLPVVMYHHREVRADIITFRSPAAERRRLALGAAVSVLFLGLLAYSGWDFMMRSLPTVSPTLGLSRAWFAAPIPIGAALAALAILIRIPPQPGEPSAEPS
jgi:TRAP-type transport system small permease protein